MKKILFFATALAGLFLAGSCQRENLEPAGNTVTYTVQLADAVGTKALGDEINQVDELVYEVWRTEGREITAFNAEKDNLLYHRTADVDNGVATIELEFVNDQNFTVLFWAHTAGNNVYNVEHLTNVTIESPDVANNPDAQAFVGRDFVKDCVSDKGGKVTLTRPVAQLNIGTTYASLDAFNPGNEADVTITGSSVEVTGLATSYNIATLSAGEASTEEYKYNYDDSCPLPTDPLNVNGTNYKYVAMNYVGFPANDGSNVTVTYVINTSEGNIDNEDARIENVPVKANYRTNIIGNLITSKTDYIVTLDNTWRTPAEVVEMWDGETLKAPAFDAATETWTINNGAELAWVAAFVNETLPDTRSTVPTYVPTHKFILGKNINLGDNEFTPIGVGGKRFSSTFDGNGHIISNFKITKYTGDQAALFGNLAGTVNIKNLTIQKANIVYPGQGDFYASGLVATAYGNVTIENVIVEKSYISGNNKVAGLLAHDGVVSSLNIINCHVRDCKIESLNEADGGNVGGLVGLLQAGITHNITRSSVKNTVINAINSSDTGKRANSEFVACVYDPNDLKVVINNCEVSGNTFRQNAGVTYVSPFGVFVGGIRPTDNRGVPTVIVDNQNVAGTAEEFAYLVNNAKKNITIALTADLEGKISLTQNAGIAVTILGNDHKFTGGLHIWGNGASDDRSMTIKNINFDGTGLTVEEGCIYTTGNVNGVNSYACNVTIEDCTFTGAGVAAIRQNVAGEKDWTIRNCTVADNMHSLLQVSNTNKGDDGYGLLVENCKVYSKNGANLNYTCYATFIDCEFDVRGYAVRVGVNDNGNPNDPKLFNFTDCNFTSGNLDGDAVVIVRRTAENATFNFVNTTLDGNPQISGYTSATKINGIELPQQNYEIWYTATALVHAHFYKDKFGEGTDLVSNVWDETTGKGVITLSGDVTTIGVNAFYGREHLISVSIPNSVTEIGEDAFDGCPNLTTVNFNANLKTIGPGAFGGCAKLTNVVLPDGLTTIADAAFQSCEAMSSITIPSTVTSIGASAFNLARRDFKVYCKPTTPPTVGYQPFNKWWAEIYVPTASLTAYQEAWGSVADNIYDGNF